MTPAALAIRVAAAKKAARSRKAMRIACGLALGPTPRERELLTFLVRHSADNRRGPLRKEISAALGLRSHGHINVMLRRLQAMGFVFIGHGARNVSVANCGNLAGSPETSDTRGCTFRSSSAGDGSLKGGLRSNRASAQAGSYGPYKATDQHTHSRRGDHTPDRSAASPSSAEPT